MSRNQAALTEAEVKYTAAQAEAERLRGLVNDFAARAAEAEAEEVSARDAAETANRLAENAIKKMCIRDSYFMIGLPFESDSDLRGIADLCQKILRLAKANRPPEVKKPIQISLGVSSFVPKCDTPFQWQPQDSIEELKRKQDLLREYIKPLRCV